MSTVGWSAALGVLRRVPATFKQLLSGLDVEWTTADEGPETFSPHDVIGHLADLEATDWVPRIQLILGKGDGEPFDPVDRFAFKSWASELDLDAVLYEFQRRREANLQTVDELQLQESDYDRLGSHPALGSVTLGQLIATWVVHDLTHVAQVARVMAKRYGEAVGPWEAYLSVLHDRPSDGGS